MVWLYPCSVGLWTNSQRKLWSIDMLFFLEYQKHRFVVDFTVVPLIFVKDKMFVIDIYFEVIWQL